MPRSPSVHVRSMLSCSFCLLAGSSLHLPSLPTCHQPTSAVNQCMDAPCCNVQPTNQLPKQRIVVFFWFVVRMHCAETGVRRATLRTDRCLLRIWPFKTSSGTQPCVCTTTIPYALNICLLAVTMATTTITTTIMTNMRLRLIDGVPISKQPLRSCIYILSTY